MHFFKYVGHKISLIVGLRGMMSFPFAFRFGALDIGQIVLPAFHDDGDERRIFFDTALNKIQYNIITIFILFASAEN